MAVVAGREAFCGAGLELRPSNKAEHFTISRHAFTAWRLFVSRATIL